MRNDDWDAPKVLHLPLHPPRDCTPGEGIYLRLWRQWAEANAKEWESIFVTTGPIRQRAASVAASFMVYMGCNGGRGFTWECERAAEQTHFREVAYLTTWAKHNARTHGVNHGLRTIEYMLAREYPINNRPFKSIDWRKVPAVTMDDIDYVESMVRWWASRTAAAMRSVAEPMIEAETTARRAGLFGIKEAPNA